MTPDRIKQIRKALGMTQKQLARALRMHPVTGLRTVRRWETGKYPITGPASVALEYMEAYFEDSNDTPPSMNNKETP